MTPDEIRALRERLDLTQEEFGQLVGVAGITVSRWELGKATPSRLADNQLVKLAKRKGRPAE